MIQKIIQTIKKVTTIPKRSDFKSSREYALQVETSLNEHKEFNADLVKFAPKLNTAIDEINATTEQIEQTKTATDEALTSIQSSKTNLEQTIQTAKTDINQSVTNAKQSEQNAKQSEANAKQSETNIKTSETATKQSEQNAKQSELNAKQSEINASNIVLGQVFNDSTENNITGWSSQKIKQEINAIPKIDAYTKSEANAKYLPKTQTARDSHLLNGKSSSVSPTNNSIVSRNQNGYIYATYFNSTANDIGNNRPSHIWVTTSNDNFLRKMNSNSFIGFLNAYYPAKNATNTAQGGVKVRLSGTTLYITSNGANA